MNPRFVGTLICLILVACIAGGFILWYKHDKTASCDQFKNSTVKDLPVRCLPYFNLK